MDFVCDRERSVSSGKDLVVENQLFVVCRRANCTPEKKQANT
jgi:hypothetical protein